MSPRSLRSWPITGRIAWGRPRPRSTDDPMTSYRALITATVIGVMVAVAAGFVIGSEEARVSEAAFESEAADSLLAITGEMNASSDVLDTLRRFVELDDAPPTRTAFQAFAKRSRMRVPALRDSGYAARVAGGRPPPLRGGGPSGRGAGLFHPRARRVRRVPARAPAGGLLPHLLPRPGRDRAAGARAQSHLRAAEAGSDRAGHRDGTARRHAAAPHRHGGRSDRRLHELPAGLPAGGRSRNAERPRLRRLRDRPDGGERAEEDVAVERDRRAVLRSREARRAHLLASGGEPDRGPAASHAGRSLRAAALDRDARHGRAILGRRC